MSKGKLKKQKALPVFGVGPIYVLICLFLTIIGLLLNRKGYLKAGEISGGKILFAVFGVLSIFLGIWLWVSSVIVQNISEEIKQGKLVTTGVYGIVRNPIYSAFLFIFSGVLLLFKNWILLVLPFVFWAILTLLMKFTEELWLEDKFGEDYIVYCKRVNRAIPCFLEKIWDNGDV